MGKTNRYPKRNHAGSKGDVGGGGGGGGGKGKGKATGMNGGNFSSRPIREGRKKTRREKPNLIDDPAAYERSLREQLNSMGLYVAHTIGDGNCLFRALSDQLYGSPRHFQAIRSSVCDYLSDHKEKYEAFVDEEVYRGGWNAYLNGMRMNGTYGGHLELSAFARYYYRPIKVIQPGLVYVVSCEDESPSPQKSESPKKGKSKTIIESEDEEEEGEGPGDDEEEQERGDEDTGVDLSSVSSQIIQSTDGPPLSARNRRKEKQEKLKREMEAEMEMEAKIKGRNPPAKGKNKVKGKGKDVMDGVEKELEMTTGPVFIAYHNWEHYSSVRNLEGPHEGLPRVRETRRADSNDEVSLSEDSRPNSPTPTPEEKLLFSSLPPHLQSEVSLPHARELIDSEGSWELALERILAEIDDEENDGEENVTTKQSPSELPPPPSQRCRPRPRLHALREPSPAPSSSEAGGSHLEPSRSPVASGISSPSSSIGRFASESQGGSNDSSAVTSPDMADESRPGKKGRVNLVAKNEAGDTAVVEEDGEDGKADRSINAPPSRSRTKKGKSKETVDKDGKPIKPRGKGGRFVRRKDVASQKRQSSDEMANVSVQPPTPGPGRGSEDDQTSLSQNTAATSNATTTTSSLGRRSRTSSEEVDGDEKDKDTTGNVMDVSPRPKQRRRKLYEDDGAASKDEAAGGRDKGDGEDDVGSEWEPADDESEFDPTAASAKSNSRRRPSQSSLTRRRSLRGKAEIKMGDNERRRSLRSARNPVIDAVPDSAMKDDDDSSSSEEEEEPPLTKTNPGERNQKQTQNRRGSTAREKQEIKRKQKLERKREKNIKKVTGRQVVTDAKNKKPVGGEKEKVQKGFKELKI